MPGLGVAALSTAVIASAAAAAAPIRPPAGALAAARDAVSRGLRLASTNRPAEAIAPLEEAIALAPDDDATLVNLGLVWEEVGLPLTALEYYTRALDVNPAQGAAYQHLGSVLYDHLGEAELSEEALRMSVSLQPARADGWNQLGKLLHSAPGSRLDEAEDAMARSVALAPTDAAMLTNHASVLRAMGRFDEAVQRQRVAAVVGTGGDVDASLAYYIPLEGVHDCRHDSSHDSRHESSHDSRSNGTSASTAVIDSASAAAPPEAAVSRVGAVVAPSALPATTPARWSAALRRVHVSRVAEAVECEWLTQIAEAHAASSGGTCTHMHACMECEWLTQSWRRMPHRQAGGVGWAGLGSSCT